MAASQNTRRLGLSRSAGFDNGATIHFALSREAVQLWISGLPEPGGSSGIVAIIEAGGNWRAVDRRFHDGSGSECERASVSASGLHLF